MEESTASQMKQLKMFFIIIPFLLNFECNAKKGVSSNSDDKIELTAIKKQDLANNPKSYGGMMKKDGRFWDNVHPVVTGLPDSLENIELHYDWANNVQALFQAYKAGKVQKKDFEYYIGAWGSDTTDCSTEYVKTYIVIATGISKHGKRYYVLDTNNNYSFADEIPSELGDRNTFQLGNSTVLFQPHKVIYEKYVDRKIQKDSTWVAFFEQKGRMLLRCCEHTEASFQSGSVKYNVKAYPARGASTEYKEGTSFEISSDNKPTQQVKKGELVKLDNAFYQIDCSIDGLKINLTRTSNKAGGTQIGMAPLSFNAISLKGDSIHFPADFKGKYVLLDFWATSCAPCIQEMRDYYIDIYKKYGGKQFEIVGVADNLTSQLTTFIEKNSIKWMIIPDGKSKLIQKKYRVNQYPTLFFINPEGVIISKDSELRGGKFESILKGKD